MNATPESPFLRRLVRPTIGRKFTLLFAVILLVGMTSGLAAQRGKRPESRLPG